MKKKLIGKSVVAEGEQTGHAHRLKGDIDIYQYEDGVKEYSLEKDTELTHEEHDTFILPKGDYFEDEVVETDHLLNEVRRVAD